MADKDVKGCSGDNNDKSTSKKIDVRDKIHRTPPIIKVARMQINQREIFHPPIKQILRLPNQ